MTTFGTRIAAGSVLFAVAGCTTTVAGSPVLPQGASTSPSQAAPSSPSVPPSSPEVAPPSSSNDKPRTGIQQAFLLNNGGNAAVVYGYVDGPKGWAIYYCARAAAGTSAELRAYNAANREGETRAKFYGGGLLDPGYFNVQTADTFFALVDASKAIDPTRIGFDILNTVYDPNRVLSVQGAQQGGFSGSITTPLPPQISSSDQLCPRLTPPSSPTTQALSLTP